MAPCTCPVKTVLPCHTVVFFLRQESLLWLFGYGDNPPLEYIRHPSHCYRVLKCIHIISGQLPSCTTQSHYPPSPLSPFKSTSLWNLTASLRIYRKLLAVNSCIFVNSPCMLLLIPTSWRHLTTAWDLRVPQTEVKYLIPPIFRFLFISFLFQTWSPGTC